MDAHVVFSKTDKGRREMEGRHFHLPQRLRTALILVDGQSDVGQLHEKATALPDLEYHLEQLAIQGFIRANTDDWKPTADAGAETEGQPAQQIKDQLIDMAILTLGDESAKPVKKLREAPATKEGLGEAVKSCKKLVRLTIDETKAAELEEKCSALLERL